MVVYVEIHTLIFKFGLISQKKNLIPNEDENWAILSSIIQIQEKRIY